MDTRWYSVAISCGKCKKDAILASVCYSADGEFLFTFYCVDCKEELCWRVFASSLQHIALQKDLEHCQRILQPRPVRPPLALPPEKLTDKDKKLLSDFGINPEEE